MATCYTTFEGLRYHVIDGRAMWESPSLPVTSDITDHALAAVSSSSPRSTIGSAELLHELHMLCHDQRESIEDVTARLDGLKAEVVAAARRSHGLQLELQELERTIALHVQHRMEAEEKQSARRGAPVAAKAGLATTTTSGAAAAVPRLTAASKQHYEVLVYLLRVHPSWLAQMVVDAAGHERPLLIRTILFVLFADLYDEECEALLLELIEEALGREMRRCEVRARAGHTAAAPLGSWRATAAPLGSFRAAAPKPRTPRRRARW